MRCVCVATDMAEDFDTDTLEQGVTLNGVTLGGVTL